MSAEMKHFSEKEPICTLYVRNINEKVNCSWIKSKLKMVFTNYGEVLQIQASKGLKKRGQAWVTLSDQTSAAMALEKAQGFSFFDKPLVVAYANRKSAVEAKVDGSYGLDGVDREMKPRRVMNRAKTSRDKAKATDNAVDSKKRQRRDSVVDSSIAGERDDHDVFEPQAKKKVLIECNIPNHTLLAQQLPVSFNDEQANEIFGDFPGFKEVRIVPGNKGMAFIEFEMVEQATTTLQKMNGEVIESQQIFLTYAKK